MRWKPVRRFGTKPAGDLVAPPCGTSPFARWRDIPPRRKTMRIHKSMLAVAVVFGIGLSAQAWAQDHDQSERGPGDNNASNTEDNSSGDNRGNEGIAAGIGLSNASANNSSSASTSIASSFNTNTAVAETNLLGAVTGNSVLVLGNIALNGGSADGGDGGAGLGGIALGAGGS